VTKQLASINEKNLKLGDKSKFQLVLFGFDSSEDANANYMIKKKINFPGMKLAGREKIGPLLKKGDTGFVPNIVVLKPDGEFVSNDQGEVLKLLNKLAP
jgi:hypothetical protein